MTAFHQELHSTRVELAGTGRRSPPVRSGARVSSRAWRAHGGLAQWEGDVAVAGLDGPVEVVRDANGVAYIQASTRRDALFAQGFVHAQDRFWQMSLTRQTMAGRLAEWIGRPAFNSDQRMRHFAGEELARRLWEQFPEEERPLLEAYAAGVNAWLDSPAYRRPPEMVILHLHPERWRPEDAFLIWRGLYEPLATPGLEGLLPAVRRVAAHPSAEEMIDGFMDTTVPIIPAEGADETVQRSQPMKEQAFSNSWLLSGEHTASGLPLLANDPQLAATLPNTWYLMRLAMEEGRMVGASIPGLPGLPLGHNGRIAIGATNAMVDVYDIALVQLDPDDAGRFRRGPDEPWQPFDTRTETIRVRFGRTVEQQVRSTPDGIVMLWDERPDRSVPKPMPGPSGWLLTTAMPAPICPSARIRAW